MERTMKLEDLQVDTHVAGIEPSGPVKILYIQKAGPDSINVTYELLSGQVLKKALFRADEAKLKTESATRVWAFDARPDIFKLAAEATRIKLAHLFDPMMAVHTSDVDPLPHQISAVYEAMLPKQPLRFVLADDPGAGKTIMAGLLIRELMLRGDLERCLIIAPGSLVEQWQTELSEKFGMRSTCSPTRSSSRPPRATPSSSTIASSPGSTSSPARKNGTTSSAPRARAGTWLSSMRPTRWPPITSAAR